MMCMQSKVSGGFEKPKVYDLSIPPTLVAKLYRSMSTYSNHFRVALWPEASNMATYDSRVVGEFEHTPCVSMAIRNPIIIWVSYVGECKEILELDYGVTKVLVLLCSWVWATTSGIQVGTKKDDFGFTFIHFGRLLLVREQPFCLPCTV